MKLSLVILLAVFCILEIGAKPTDVSSEEIGEIESPENADSTVGQKRISKKSLKKDDQPSRDDDEEDDEDGAASYERGADRQSVPAYYQVKSNMEQLQDPKVGLNATQPAGNWTNPADNPVASSSTTSQAKATNGTVPAVSEASQKPANQTAVKSQPQMMPQVIQNATQTTLPSATQPPTTQAPVIVAKSNTTANATTV